MNKIQKSIWLVCGLVTCNMVFAVPQHKTHEQSLDRVVAIVNDNVITESELDDSINQVKKQMAANNTPLPPEAILHKRLLEQLIDRRLQLQIAEQAGIKVTDADINKTVSGIAEQNKLTTSELYEKLAQSGMREEDYRKEIHDEMIIHQLQQQEIGTHIMITPQEVDDFMRSASWQAYSKKEYHLEDILITLPEAPTPKQVATAKKQAEKVLAKIHHGASFHDVAMADSGDADALKGGDVGWMKLPQIPPEFAGEIVHMKPNDVFGPVATPNGFHIIRLAGVRDINTHESADAQRKQVEQLLFQRKLDEGLQNWLAKLRGEAFINTNPES